MSYDKLIAVAEVYTGRLIQAQSRKHEPEQENTFQAKISPKKARKLSWSENVFVYGIARMRLKKTTYCC